MMRAIIVIELNLPNPDVIVDVVHHLDPPTIPHFAGSLQIAVEPSATQVIDWLNDGTADTPEEERLRLGLQRLIKDRNPVAPQAIDDLLAGNPPISRIDYTEET